MSSTETGTRQIVRGYHDARFAGDVPAALARLAEPFAFRSPLMSSQDPAGHLVDLTGFLRVVTGLTMISELYGHQEATLVYDVHTATPVGVQRTAEHFRLAGDAITSITLIFDATPWQAMLPHMGRTFG